MLGIGYRYGCHGVMYAERAQLDDNTSQDRSRQHPHATPHCERRRRVLLLPAARTPHPSPGCVHSTSRVRLRMPGCISMRPPLRVSLNCATLFGQHSMLIITDVPFDNRFAVQGMVAEFSREESLRAFYAGCLRSAPFALAPRHLRSRSSRCSALCPISL